MKILILVLMLLAPAASATDIVCSLPAANVVRSLELCEERRIRMGIRLSEWSNEVCASEFFRDGLINAERQSATRFIRKVNRDFVNNEVDTYEATWPKLIAAFCGDGTLDTEVPFNEECDDGNQTDLDGCDASCNIEP